MTAREFFETFRGHRVPHLNIIGRSRVWFAISGFFIVLSILGLAIRGLNFSIEFTGGALVQFTNRSGASVPQYQSVMSRFGIRDAEVELLGSNTVSIRTEDVGLTATATTPSASPTPSASVTPTPSTSASASASASPSAAASASPSASASPAASSAAPTGGATLAPVPGVNVAGLTAALARTAGISIDEVSVQAVGPTWGSTITRKAVISLVIFLVLVTLFITIVFSEWKMAAAALVALVHDIIITAGIFALVGRAVTPETVIAFLTILGYSLYDTVVIFDKIKENTESAGLVARETYSGVVNMSVNQTFMRSVNTSLVVLLPIGALLLFGGQTLKDFAFALFIGVASGAYSSIFIASPVLAMVKEREPRFQQIRARLETRAARPGLRSVAAGDGDGEAATARRTEAAAVASAGSAARTAATAGSPRPRAGSGTSRKGGGKGRPQGKAKRRRR
jgi:preprotein translocase subunit SecF